MKKEISGNFVEVTKEKQQSGGGLIVLTSW